MPDREPNVELQVQRFVAFLRQKRMKITQERLDLVRAIFDNDEHFEAEDLLIRMRHRQKRVSKATIYRTLPLLIESGLLRQSYLSSEKQTYYEHTLGLDRHEHMICVHCGKVIEFASKKLEEALREETEQRRFQPERRRIEVFGLCEDCR